MTAPAARIPSAVVVEELDALLGYGYGVDDALAAIGLSYDATRRAVRARGRADLLAALSEFKAGELDRQLMARGIRRW